MAAPTNHFKIGLFVILSLAAIIVVTVALGAQSVKKETVLYTTYFNESVQGLDVGAPVKFRGVPIGVVAGVQIAPDHRHVEVLQELDSADVVRMGIAEHVPPDLRAQLGSQGITGVKFVSIDFFDPKHMPAPELPFPTPTRYIPAAPSVLKSLEDTLVRAMDRMPELVDAVVAITGRIDRMVAQLEENDVAGHAAATLEHADQVLVGLNRAVSRIDHADLGGKASATLGDVSKAVAKLNSVLDKIDGEDGLLASVRRTSDAFGALGTNAGGSTRELDKTLREVREAADAIRNLTEAMERDPDMLIKGRAKTKTGGPR